jgi:hypothetical protein
MMDQKHYVSLVAITRQIYDMILNSREPRKFPQRLLQGDLLSAITNKWLVFQNIKNAALSKDFTLVQIGYNRSEALLAAKAETEPDRKAFVEWAVAYIRSKGKIKINKESLSAAWSARGGPTCAKSFFTSMLGTALSMQELRTLAFPDGQSEHPPWRHATTEID